MSPARASGVPALLVVAKAPVPGEAKTRLAAALGGEAAADVAAAALLDTLEVVRATGCPSVVALTGDMRAAVRRREVEQALAEHRVVEQRGRGFAQRLAHAHADAAAAVGTTAVVQVGMDTPQLTVALLASAVAALGDADAALGPARDGGWWCLAVGRVELARCLAEVPMSRPDTGVRTRSALLRSGAGAVTWLDELRDVDTLSDALEVARTAPGSRLAAALDTALTAVGVLPQEASR